MSTLKEIIAEARSNYGHRSKPRAVSRGIGCYR